MHRIEEKIWRINPERVRKRVRLDQRSLKNWSSSLQEKRSSPEVGTVKWAIACFFICSAPSERSLCVLLLLRLNQILYGGAVRAAMLRCCVAECYVLLFALQALVSRLLWSRDPMHGVYDSCFNSVRWAS